MYSWVTTNDFSIEVPDGVHFMSINYPAFIWPLNLYKKYIHCLKGIWIRNLLSIPKVLGHKMSWPKTGNTNFSKVFKWICSPSTIIIGRGRSNVTNEGERSISIEGCCLFLLFAPFKYITIYFWCFVEKKVTVHFATYRLHYSLRNSTFEKLWYSSLHSATFTFAYFGANMLWFETSYPCLKRPSVYEVHKEEWSQKPALPLCKPIEGSVRIGVFGLSAPQGASTKNS